MLHTPNTLTPYHTHPPQSRPVLIETMSYRVGHHSTSDDSTRYRPAAEIKRWREEDDPVERYRLWVEGEGGLGEERVQEIRDEEKINVSLHGRTPRPPFKHRA